MRIFYITSVLGDSGGSEIYTRDLLLELMRRGHELCVATTTRYTLPGAEMVFIPRFGHHGLHKFAAPLFAGKVLAAARKFKPDLVQIHSNCFMGYLGHRVKEALGVPHVCLIELLSGVNFSLHAKAIHASEKFLLPKLNYDKLIVWTENMKQRFLLPWGVPEEKIAIIPAALNLENYRLDADGAPDGAQVKKVFGDPGGAHLITSIKTLWHSNAKGLEYVIRAMQDVHARHPEYTYVIFGEGGSRAGLERLVERLGLEGCVKLPGGISPRDCPEVWAATEIAPHSFVYEFSTSISLLEYMAMGRACVVTDMGAVREVVGDAALVVEPENARALAEGINKLIEDKKRREELGRKARKRVEENYSIGKAVEKLEGVYRELLA